MVEEIWFFLNKWEISNETSKRSNEGEWFENLDRISLKSWFITVCRTLLVYKSLLRIDGVSLRNVKGIRVLYLKVLKLVLLQNG